MSDPRQVVPERLQVEDPRGGDPLRLCVFATVCLLGWLLGPLAVLVFAGLGFSGYLRARRAGLLRSRCLLGDTRVVLVYLGVLTVLAVLGFAWRVTQGGWGL
ncbi:hypothetical protein G9U51_10050 [Calidifontibacter sp. DB0510]|uniref:Uncharacterized protein n=1 Tax=Metallococcus carri TaxID=1656884 RepID=A0A967EHA9_9MICO|nr:hypothetical protein [Metallococcus carri]NHN56118.1 hypothetical protein [Metallococcus carri]NOP37425.1 hypothetical protein [Calidifontibacter sp. DB2511S]